VRNKYLTPAMETVLKWMARPYSDDNDGEIVTEGLDIWYGLNRTNRIVLKKLLVLCLISDVSLGNERLRRYAINEDGRRIIKDPRYVPQIIRALRRRTS
jgi:hypothetical protein